MLTGRTTEPAHDADSALYRVGFASALAGAAVVANRSARIDRRFESTVVA
jgi:hypothetical protein